MTALFQVILLTSNLSFSCFYNKYIFKILCIILVYKIKQHKYYLHSTYLAHKQFCELLK